MKKQILLGLITACLVSNSAFAKENKSLFFMKHKISVGFDMQTHKGELGDYIDSYNNKEGYTTNKFNMAPIINIGSNLYLNINSVFNPFIGIDSQVRLPLLGKENISGVTKPAFVSDLQIGEYFRLNAKIGSRINLYKQIAVEPYALVGLNVVKMKYNFNTLYSNYDYKKTKTGMTVGTGIDVIIDRVVIGFEYRYGTNKFNIDEVVGDFYSNEVKIKTYSFAFKVGFEF